MTGTGSSWNLSVQRREAADRQREGKCQRQRCITRWSREMYALSDFLIMVFVMVSEAVT